MISIFTRIAEYTEISVSSHEKPTLAEVLLKETFIWDNSLNDVVSCYLEKLGYRKNDLNIIAEFNSEQLAKDSVIDGLGLAFYQKYL